MLKLATASYQVCPFISVVITLPLPICQAIMRIQGGISGLFREFMVANNFMEMHTPKLLAGASEGGSSVFE
jgi:aspartyl-tRNA synthetase